MRGALSLKPSYYEALKRLTLQLAGVRMGSDHAFLVETRLASLARKEGFESLDSMVQELFAVGQARLALQVVSALVERDTHFNRDPLSLDRLFDIALRELAETRGGGRIDLLSYGCGSGQDLYSVAIRSRYAANKALLGGTTLHMTGVDYPSQALERARAGRYTHFEVQRGLSARDMISHFTPDPAPGSTDWLAAEHLRENIAFHDLHLMSANDALGDFHVVMFRAPLAQYSRPATLRILRTLIKRLRPYGYLVLNSDEAIGADKLGLQEVDGITGLYKKRDLIAEKEAAELAAKIKVPTDRKTFHDAPPATRQAKSA